MFHHVNYNVFENTWPYENNREIKFPVTINVAVL